MPITARYKLYFTDRQFLVSIGTSAALFVVSLFVNWYAGIYASREASNSVTDIILSNTRVYDLDGIFIYGPFVLWSFVAYLFLKDPNKIPFTLKSIALFVLVRSVFITLTHIGPFPTELNVSSSEIIQKFMFGGDLFFSGHTGLPFLMALVFWQKMYLRIIFIVTAILFGVVVLLAHLHYSIDVLSAFFITYTIFHLSELFFKKDRTMFFHTHAEKP